MQTATLQLQFIMPSIDNTVLYDALTKQQSK